MLLRLIVLVFIAMLAYWFWSGPYQDLTTESYEARLLKNTKIMRRCLSSKEYYAGATGGSTDTAAEQEAQCAEKHGLYQHRGRWRNFKTKRPEG